MSEKVANMISLARRAGRIESGDVVVRAAISRRRAKLIILAGDAAEKTKEIFRCLAGDGGIPVIQYRTKDELGKVLGKPLRSVAAVTDENFAQGVIRAIERGEAGEK